MSIKILLVDDSSTMRRIQKNTLKNIGYTDVDEAEDGEDAYSKIKKNDYNLVLLDWNMPILDGYECLKRIKTNDALKHTPVIMVTSESEKSRIIDAVKAGASNYLVKPFRPEDLKSKITAVLAKPA